MGFLKRLPKASILKSGVKGNLRVFSHPSQTLNVLLFDFDRGKKLRKAVFLARLLFAEFALRVCKQIVLLV